MKLVWYDEDQYYEGYPLNHQLQSIMSQLIVNIGQFYPYNQRPNPNFKTSFRRLVKFSSPEQCSKLKARIGIIRKLNHSNLIAIRSLLYDQHSIHLLYDHIQSRPIVYALENWTEIRTALLGLAAEFQSRDIVLEFVPQNMAMTPSNTMKYHLDIVHLHERAISKQSIRFIHSQQIDRLIHYFSRDRAELRSLDNTSCRIQNEGLQKYQSKSCNALDKYFEKPIQLLQRIEQKLAELRRVTKKYSPAVRESYRSKLTITETELETSENYQIVKSPKRDNRKMSGHTIYACAFMSKDKKRKHFEQPEQPDSVYSGKYSTKHTTCLQTRLPSDTSSDMKKAKTNAQVKTVRQPTTKKDFVQIQKQQFENFATIKSSCVQDFLGVLMDDPPSEPAFSEKPPNAKSSAAKLLASSPLKKMASTPIKQKESPCKDTCTVVSYTKSQNKTRETSKQLKDRVTDSIKNSDVAMFNFRKNSMCSLKK